MKQFLTLLLAASIPMLSAGCKNEALVKTEDPRLQDIKLPEGFTISIFAKDVENARSLAQSPDGTVYVGSRDKGNVYALQDTDDDGKADKRYLIAEGLNSPNGVAFYNGDLYVAEISKIWRYPAIQNNLNTPPEPVLVTDRFPTDKHHGWKYIAFGPDNKLYVPVGAPCNVCKEDDPIYSTITRINPDGSDFEIYAEGIRNTVGFDWHPETGVLWFTENGRDRMGDNVPADELNRAPQKGMHFGFPYCHAGDVPDPEYGEGHNCNEYVPPVIKLAPHTAALGMKFYTGDMFPAEYKNQIFIAEHGSWNRSTPIGYRVMLVRTNGENATSYDVFAEGWLKDGKAWGRPVDVLQLKDGSLLVSDDHASVIYRITYNK